MTVAEQLTLSIQLEPEYTFENFMTGDNQALVNSLLQLPDPNTPYLYLWGNPGVGRSHLLQATCHAFIKQGLSTFYLSLKNHQQYQVEILNGLEAFNLFIDDVDSIAGCDAWQEALFHCFNRVMATPNQLIIAGNAAPRQLPLELADLKSRLCSGLIYQVQGLNDQDKVTALIKQAENRGLPLAEDVALYILHHGPRDMRDLTELLQQLDDASLSSQRRLTIPFVKSVLGW